MVDPKQDWPTYFHEKLQYDWVLSKTCRDNCECYFLRHWEYKYLATKLFQFEDTISEWELHLDGEFYKVVFMDDDLNYHSEKQIALSFRKPKPELNLPAYVLVKGISS